MVTGNQFLLPRSHEKNLYLLNYRKSLVGIKISWVTFAFL